MWHCHDPDLISIAMIDVTGVQAYLYGGGSPHSTLILPSLVGCLQMPDLLVLGTVHGGSSGSGSLLKDSIGDALPDRMIEGI